jgi:PEP-CTERM motif
MKIVVPVLAAAFVATVGFAASASASLVSVSFVDFGGGVQPPSAPPGEKNVPISAADLTGTFALVTGSSSGTVAAPAFSATTSDPNQYLAELGGQSATLSLGGSFQGVEIYVGSLDSYNTISFSNGLSFTGAQLAAMTTAVDDGNQTAGSSNGLFFFRFTPGEAVKSVTFASSANSLEVAGVSESAVVPEPSTWVMLALGFVGLGYAAVRRSSKDRSALAL